MTAGGRGGDPLPDRARPLVLDSHVDTPSRILYEGFRLDSRARTGHVDIARLRAGGVDAVVFAIFIDKAFSAERGRSAIEAIRMLDAAAEEVARHPRDLALCRTAAETRAAAAGGRIAVLFGLEGGHAIEDDLALLRAFARLGVRYLTLTHVNSNGWCDSSADAPRWGGLNALGREAIAEMNRVGIVPDVSHVSDAAFEQVLEASARPVVASHSSCRALCDSPRNLTDGMLRALARKGGVAMINAYPAFLSSEYRAAANRRDAAHADAEKAIAKAFPGPENAWRRWTEWIRFAADHPPQADLPSLAAVAEHVMHAVAVAGEDHVGLGTDFDGIPVAPRGFEDCSRIGALRDDLARRGLGPPALRKFLGENFLRVLEASEPGVQESRAPGR